jgi:hypothetical protein
VQVLSYRRTEYSKNSIAHFAVDDPVVLMHSGSHLLHSWCQASDGVFQLKTGNQVDRTMEVGSQD